MLLKNIQVKMRFESTPFDLVYFVTFHLPETMLFLEAFPEIASSRTRIAKSRIEQRVNHDRV
jgi:hypothetical protein